MPMPTEALGAGEPILDGAGLIAADYDCAGCNYNLRTLRRDAGCPECGLAVEETVARRKDAARSLYHPSRFPVVFRLAYAGLGIALPAVCFAMAAAESPLADWQDGHWRTYVALLYGGWPLVVFWPVLIYAMAAMALVLVDPMRWSKRLLTRFGVYTGVALAAQYLLVMAVGIGGWKLPVLVLVGMVVVITASHGVRTLVAKRRWSRPVTASWQWVLLALAGVAAVFAFPFIAIFLVLLAPAWTLLAYVMMTLRLRATACEPSPPLRVASLLLGWLTAYTASWALAITLAIEAYAKLPTQPPGCYVATAAANGHARFVGSRPVRCADGRVMRVNRQLRVCKVAELALRAVTPRAHRALRAIYDTLGPPLARLIRHPLAADAAYLALAPPAWLAELLLRRLGCDVERLSRRIYPQVVVPLAEHGRRGGHARRDRRA